MARSFLIRNKLGEAGKYRAIDRYSGLGNGVQRVAWAAPRFALPVNVYARAKPGPDVSRSICVVLRADMAHSDFILGAIDVELDLLDDDRHCSEGSWNEDSRSHLI